MSINVKRPINDKGKLKDRYMGSLVGFSIGDAMGATTEFMSKRMVKETYGELRDIIGGGWLNLQPGEVTDDTQMTVAIIKVFLENKDCDLTVLEFKQAVMDKFVEWYEFGPADIGAACLAGIKYYLVNGDFISEDKSRLGNGGLMRALPCYLLGLLDYNYAQNDLTHNNSICRHFIKSYHETMDMAISGARFNLNRKAEEPLGHVRNTYFNAQLYGLGTSSFEETIIRAVNDGGDADTIAAIAGSIAGYKYGLGEIPYRWIDKLDSKLIHLFEDFTNMALGL